MLLAIVGFLVLRPGLLAQGLKARATLAGHPAPPGCLAFSPDGKTLASACPERDPLTGGRAADLRLWDVAAARQRAALTCHRDGLERLTFSPDGKLLATAGADYLVKLWDVPADRQRAVTERVTLEGRLPYCRCLGFSPDGRRLAAASDNDVCVWEVATGKKRTSFRRQVAGWACAFSPDLRTLASPNYQDVDLWDVVTGKERLTLPDHRGPVEHVAFSADGKVLAVGSCRHDDGGSYFAEVKLWDPVTGRERVTLKEPAGSLGHLALGPDGKTVLLQKERQLRGPSELRLLDVETGRVLATISFKGRKDTPCCLAFSPDGKTLATGCADNTVKLWDVLPDGK
jgi:WD40 repeat protein